MNSATVFRVKSQTHAAPGAQGLRSTRPAAHSCAAHTPACKLVGTRALALPAATCPDARGGSHVAVRRDVSVCGIYDGDDGFADVESEWFDDASWGDSMDEMPISQGDDDLIKLFESADTNGDGQVDHGELKAMLAEQGSLLTDEEVSAVLRKYDYSDTGVISQKEFKHLARDLLLVESHAAWFEKLYDFADKDRTGLITRSELQALMTVLYERRVEEEEVEAAFERYDVDKSGKLDKAEFMTLVRTAKVDKSYALEYILMPEGAEAGQAEGAIEGVQELGSLEELEQMLRAHPLVCVQVGFTWCRPCLGFKRKYQKFTKAFPEVHFAKLTANTDQRTKRLLKYLNQITENAITGTPAHVLFRDSDVKAVGTGAKAPKLGALLETLLGPEAMPEEAVLKQLGVITEEQLA